MKLKTVVCDFCGTQGIECDHRLKIISREEDSYANYDEIEPFKWHKLDCCKNCADNILEYIRKTRYGDE